MPRVLLIGWDGADWRILDPLLERRELPNLQGLIAEGVLPKGRPFTHPAGLEQDLTNAGMPWQINGMSWTTYRNRPEPYLDEAFDITSKRIKAAEWMMDNTDWDLFASVWVSVDRTQDCLSNYVGPDHPDYASLSRTLLAAKVRDVYKQLDDAIGSFVSRTRDD